MMRVGWVTTGQPVYASERDEGARRFAKAYTDARRGGWRTGGPTDRDEKAAAAFERRYRRVAAADDRDGFGGSGRVTFEDTRTGERYRVESSGNGAGFWGTSHAVERIG